MPRKVNPRRSRAVRAALKRMGSEAATPEALGRQARSSARRRGRADLQRAARKAVRTKGPAGRRAAAKKAALTRKRNRR